MGSGFGANSAASGLVTAASACLPFARFVFAGCDNPLKGLNTGPVARSSLWSFAFASARTSRRWACEPGGATRPAKSTAGTISLALAVPINGVLVTRCAFEFQP